MKLIRFGIMALILLPVWKMNVFASGPNLPVQIQPVELQRWATTAPKLTLSIRDARVTDIQVRSTFTTNGRDEIQPRESQIKVPAVLLEKQQLLPEAGYTYKMPESETSSLDAKLSPTDNLESGLYAERVRLDITMSDRESPFEMESYRFFEVVNGEVHPLTAAAYERRIDPIEKAYHRGETILMRKGGGGSLAIKSENDQNVKRKQKISHAIQDEAPGDKDNLQDGNRLELDEP